MSTALIWQRLHVRNSFYQLQAVPPTGSGEWTQAGPSWLRKSLECELTASSLGGKLCENHIPVLEKPNEGAMRSHQESISASRSNWRRNSRISRHSKGEIKRCHVRNIPWTRVKLRNIFLRKSPCTIFNVLRCMTKWHFLLQKPLGFLIVTFSVVSCSCLKPKNQNF